MPLPSKGVLILLALAAEWWIPFMLCMLAEHRREQRRAFVAYWQQYFNENVAEKWMHYDGMGY